MDELPREARELLALAQDAHDPPDQAARGRVKRGVLMAAAASGGAALASKAVASAASSMATGAAKTGLLATASAKMFLAGSVIVVASAVTVVAPRITRVKRENTHQQAERAHKAKKPVSVKAEPAALPAPVRAPTPASAPEVVQAPSEVPVVPEVQTARIEARHVKRAAHELARAHAVPSLEAEMKLLQAASDAIAARELGRARSLLSEHRKTFPRGQLRAEREGLFALAACTQGNPAAQKQARLFLCAHPEAVLSARIRSACKLEE